MCISRLGMILTRALMGHLILLLRCLCPGILSIQLTIAHLQIVLSCSQHLPGLRSTLTRSGNDRGTTSAFLHLDGSLCLLGLGLKLWRCIFDCASRHFYFALFDRSQLALWFLTMISVVIKVEREGILGLSPWDPYRLTLLFIGCCA